MLDLAIYFQAHSIIQYLIMNGTKATECTLLIATAVGNPELIFLCLHHWWKIGSTINEILNPKLKACMMIVSTLYHHQDIYNWIKLDNKTIINFDTHRDLKGFLTEVQEFTKYNDFKI
jgi:hypothetical protein